MHVQKWIYKWFCNIIFKIRNVLKEVFRNSKIKKIFLRLFRSSILVLPTLVNNARYFPYLFINVIRYYCLFQRSSIIYRSKFWVIINLLWSLHLSIPFYSMEIPEIQFFWERLLKNRSVLLLNLYVYSCNLVNFCMQLVKQYLVNYTNHNVVFLFTLAYIPTVILSNCNISIHQSLRHNSI